MQNVKDQPEIKGDVLNGCLGGREGGGGGGSFVVSLSLLMVIILWGYHKICLLVSFG